MNIVVLVGRLTKDPELITTNNGISVCRFSIAVQRKFANEDGEREADFINIVAWRGLADTCGKYLKKGTRVGIEGSIQTRSFDGKDGTRKYAFEVVADEVEFLSPKQNEEQGEEPKEKPKAEQTKFEPIDDDNLPF